MCGISYIYKENADEKLHDAIVCMASSIAHRGPDSIEVYENNNYAMGFNRLEIVGGKEGIQPISSSDGSLRLICNGEIFNYKTLIKSNFQNIPFSTPSDVEIILHLYRKNGVGFLNKLEGQFAFVLADTEKSQTIIARDPFGINPLYYYLDEKNIVVSSEIKAIIASGKVKHILPDIQSIAETALYYGPIPPNTCFKNIKQLPPGSYGIFNHLNRTLVINSYFSYSNFSRKPNKSSLRTILKSSVKKRLQGDSKPGIYLSGGLDSSIIAALSNELSESKPVLFSITFKDKKFNESYYQKLVAKHLGLTLKSVHITWKNIVENLLDTVIHCETPLIRTAPVPMILLSRLVRENKIKFVLCGEGADELFAGYKVFTKNMSSVENKWEASSTLLSYFSDFSQQNKERVSFKDLLRKKRKDNFRDLITEEIHTKLSSYLLSNQGDRVSMANGIEQRFPFLDNHIISISKSFNKNQLIINNVGKQPLRRLAYDLLLPKEIIDREKKGYLAPDESVVKYLLCTDYIKKYLNRKITEELAIFDYSKIKNLLSKLKSSSKFAPIDLQSMLFLLTTHILFKEIKQIYVR